MEWVLPVAAAWSKQKQLLPRFCEAAAVPPLPSPRKSGWRVRSVGFSHRLSWFYRASSESGTSPAVLVENSPKITGNKHIGKLSISMIESGLYKERLSHTFFSLLLMQWKSRRVQIILAAISFAMAIIVHGRSIEKICIIPIILADQPAENNSPMPQNNCVDSDPKCSLWASQGECQTNAVWCVHVHNPWIWCHSTGWCPIAAVHVNPAKVETGLGSCAVNLLKTTTIPQPQTQPVLCASKVCAFSTWKLCDSHFWIVTKWIYQDEAKEQARIFGRLVLSWNDSKVAWDKDVWGLSWLNFYWVQVWTPQLLQINA